MLTLLPEHFELEEVTRFDLMLASLAWGFTLGMGWLTTWSAVKQSRGIWRRVGVRLFRNAYFWMIWGEITVCLAFGIICFMYLLGAIPPSFAFYFSILTLWALQVQFLLQIIINRCAILITDYRWTWRLKIGVAAIITAINISVYCIWVPARLQINEQYIHVNEWWDRCEKVIYLIVDAALNFYFIRIVQQNLVQHGLTKYRGVVRFNMFIIAFSLAMDVLIISMMSLKNTFVYMQFHPLAYIVKLKIELSMAELIAKIAKHRDPLGHGLQQDISGKSRSGGSKHAGTTLNDGDQSGGRGKAWATVTTTLEMTTMDAKGREVKDAEKEKGSPRDSDTDSLIDPASVFATMPGAVSDNHDTLRDESYRGAGGSMSSYNTYAEGATGVRQE